MNHSPSVFGAAVNSSSLSLIAGYGSEDEDDESPGGVGVQTKRELRTDEHEDQDQESCERYSNRKRLKTIPSDAPSSAIPILPNPLRSSLPAEPEWTDDPAKHGGRLRYYIGGLVGILICQQFFVCELFKVSNFAAHVLHTDHFPT